jgi:hypothetical protein
MVNFFNILFRAFWELVNIKIPIDNNLYITPISIIVFSIVLSLLIKYFKEKGESSNDN